MSRRTIVGMTALGTAMFVAVSMPAASAASPDGFGVANTGAPVAAPATSPGAVAPDAVGAFPSSNSTVVGSVGFIDAEQVGYFWSAARGDRVAETFSGPGRVRKAVLKGDIIENVLNNGAFVDWTLSINGRDVGSFTINEGQLGAFTEQFTFRRIRGGSYDVEIRVTNEVAGGEGSHTLRYAGAGPHSITLKKRP